MSFVRSKLILTGAFSGICTEKQVACDFSIGVYKFLVTARYENFQNLKLIIFNVDFSRRHVVCSISDFLILERVSGPLGGPAISYPRKRIQVKIQVYRIYTDHLKLSLISARNPCKPDLY